jgi:hypothetical protein
MSADQSPRKEHLDRLARVRKRKAERRRRQLRSDERQTYLDTLGVRGSTLGSILLAFLAGLLIGAGLRYDQRVLLVAGALTAPRVTGPLGLALGASLGDLRAVVRAGLRLSLAIAVFCLPVALTALVRPPYPPAFFLARHHATFNWLDFALLVGASLGAASYYVRRLEVPALANAAVSYELLLPLAVTVAALVRDQDDLWRGSAMIFAQSLVWSVAAAACLFLSLGLRPRREAERSLGAALGMLLPLGALSVLSLGSALLTLVPSSSPPPAPTAPPTQRPTERASATRTLPPAPTLTQSVTPAPTSTATSTPTPMMSATPTVRVGLIYGTGDLGAVVREAPGGPVIASYLEGTRLTILSGPEEVDGQLWWRVETPEGFPGWVLGSLLATATPGP